MNSNNSQGKIRKGLSKSITIGFFVIIFIILAAAVYPNQRYDNKTNSESINISDWKTYESFKYGYQIKYPDSYYLSEESSDLVLKFYAYDNQDDYFELLISGGISGIGIETIEELKNDLDREKDRFVWLEELSTDNTEAVLALDKMLGNKNNKVIYFKSPYKHESYNKWFLLGFNEDTQLTKQILSTVKFNLIVEGVDITEYIPTHSFSNPYTTNISRVGVENIDNDAINEIIFLVEYDNNYSPFTQEIIVLDKDKFGGYKYRPVTSINYFQDVYGFNNQEYRLQKTTAFTGKIETNLYFIDINNDNIKEILYFEGNNEDSFTGLRIIKHDISTDSFISVFSEFGSGLNIQNLADLDGDDMPEVVIYKDILEDDIINNEENAGLFEIYKPHFKDQYALKNKIKDEDKITLLKWFDIYKWNGEKYIINNAEFPDLYKDFLQESVAMVKKSKYDNIEINNYRNEILDYYPDEIFVAQNGDGLTHIARRAIKEHMEKFYENDNLELNQRIYAEDYLKLKYLKKYKNILIGEEVTLSVKMIDEAIIKAKNN